MPDEPKTHSFPHRLGRVLAGFYFFFGSLGINTGYHRLLTLRNHHAAPRSARHGHRWWELDPSWLTSRLFMACGLATDAVRPAALRSS